MVCFKLKQEKHYDEFDIADRLRERGWIVPAYTGYNNIFHANF